MTAITERLSDSEKGKKREVDDIKFTRQELFQRLQNLVNKSIKNFEQDDEVNNRNKVQISLMSLFNNPQLLLPGNKTKKYALRYYNEFEA